MYFVYRL